jgi:hypothetical protein
MSALTRSIAPFVAIAALLTLTAIPALAKEGAIAKLDTAIHRDAEPGSTIEVGWSVFMLVDGTEYPIHGSPIYVRLVSPDGTSTQTAGTETRSGSGHYAASMVVPAGGIQDVIVAIRGEACYSAGGCEQVDYTFPLTDDALVSGTPVGPVAGSSSAGSISAALAPVVLVGVAFALAGGAAALVLSRRREVGIETVGR